MPKIEYQPPFWSVLSPGKFDSFKQPFATITSLSELSFRSRRFILFVQTKKLTSMNYGSNTSNWKPWRWMRLDLILMMRDMYIYSNLNPLTKFTRNSRSIEFKDILPWNIAQIITNIVPISTRIVISQGIKFESLRQTFFCLHKVFMSKFA